MFRSYDEFMAGSNVWTLENINRSNDVSVFEELLFSVRNDVEGKLHRRTELKMIIAVK